MGFSVQASPEAEVNPELVPAAEGELVFSPLFKMTGFMCSEPALPVLKLDCGLVPTLERDGPP